MILFFAAIRCVSMLDWNVQVKAEFSKIKLRSNIEISPQCPHPISAFPTASELHTHEAIRKIQ